MPPPVPVTPGGKTTNHVPGLAVFPGDVIAGSADGGHVVISAHNLPQTPYVPGQSNNYVHWSYGPSRG